MRTVEKQNSSHPFVEIERKHQEFNYLYFHKSNRPFKTPGRYGYSHGGISPQELIVPFLRIQKKAASFEKLMVHIANKNELKEVVGENFEMALKTGERPDMFAMSRKIVILFLAKGQQVNKSDIITLTADKVVKKEYSFDNHTALEAVIIDAATKETLDKATIKQKTIRDTGGLL